MVAEPRFPPSGGTDSEISLVAQLPELSDNEWNDLVDRLTLYAHCRFARLIWRGVPWHRGGSAPGAAQPSDIAADAIVSVINDERIWDREKYPDFFDFLKGVVDSRVSHLVRSVENRKLGRFFHKPAGDSDVDFEGDIAASDMLPDIAVAEQEVIERLRASVPHGNREGFSQPPVV